MSLLPSPAPDDCLLFLVRHGATDNNLADPPILQGHTIDLDLSEIGRQASERTAEFFADHDIAAVYASQLKRAVQTAEIIARPHNADVTQVEDLREVDVGQWESRSWDEIAETEGDAYRAFLEDPAVNGYVGGENLQQLRDRVRPAIYDIMSNHAGHRIVVVGHNVVNRVLLAELIDLPLARARGLHQANCGINVIRLRNGRMKLLMMNSEFHLWPDERQREQ